MAEAFLRLGIYLCATLKRRALEFSLIDLITSLQWSISCAEHTEITVLVTLRSSS